MAERLRADGARVTLDLVAGAPHVFQAFAGVLPEADAALDRAAAFLRAVLPSMRTTRRPPDAATSGPPDDSGAHPDMDRPGGMR